MKQANLEVLYRKRQNPVPNEKNQAFRTGKEQILYQTRRIGHFVQEKSKSCTRRANTGILYGIWLNSVRDVAADWQSIVAEALWHRRWPYTQASGYNGKRCMELSWAPLALPLLPAHSFSDQVCSIPPIQQVLSIVAASSFGTNNGRNNSPAIRHKTRVIVDNNDETATKSRFLWKK